MSKIQIMPSSLADLIRAGEIVDHPSNIVKELVENSIDAESKNIIVSITTTDNDLKIIVKDDGCGMDRDDAILSFARHASSKLKTKYELTRIKTLGFRGEALASISSVSHVILHTSDGEVGTYIDLVPSKEMIVKDDIIRRGTTFEISDIFRNVPARFKFQNSPQKEVAIITDLLEKVAIGFDDISFTLIVDGREKFKTPGRKNLLETISKIYSVKVAASLYELKKEDNTFSFKGFVSKPEIYYGHNKNVLIYVNGRLIYSLPLIYAIKDAYSDFLPPNKYPLAVIKLTLDPSQVDVNCDPTKKTVKFISEASIRSSIQSEIRKTLLYHKPIYNIGSETVKKDLNTDLKSEQMIFTDEDFKSDNRNLYRANTNSKNIQSDILSEEKPQINYNDNDFYNTIFSNQQFSNSLPEMHPVGQVLDTYIVCQGNECMYLIDQHAAAERINYEKTSLLYSSKHDQSILLNPIIVDLTPKETANVDKEHIDRLKSIGIVCEYFGNNQIKIEEVPTFLLGRDLESIAVESIHSVLDDVEVDPISLLHLTIAGIACKKSIKANHKMSLNEIETLLMDLAKCKNPANCPHGRPTILKISKDELEKMFNRAGGFKGEK